MVLVFLNDPSCVFIGVERVHEDEGYIHIVLFVQVLNLSDRKIEESHVVPDLDN